MDYKEKSRGYYYHVQRVLVSRVGHQTYREVSKACGVDKSVIHRFVHGGSISVINFLALSFFSDGHHRQPREREGSSSEELCVPSGKPCDLSNEDVNPVPAAPQPIARKGGT